MLASVIITTYNWPEALSKVLLSLLAQTENNFEIIIADDGSTSLTKELIDKFQMISKIPIIHSWQEDNGFRAAMSRNKAINKANGEYLIFLDGDCVPRKNFIEHHLKLAKKGYFVSGNRVLLSKNYTDKIIKSSASNLHDEGIFFWIKKRFEGSINRLLPLLLIPIPRTLSKKKWRGAKTCNLAVFKRDLVKINGFEEEFSGWGYEDSDLVVRLIRSGVQRLEGKFKVPVFHLWHNENDRQNEKNNLSLLDKILVSDRILANKGLNQYID